MQKRGQFIQWEMRGAIAPYLTARARIVVEHGDARARFRRLASGSETRRTRTHDDDIEMLTVHRGLVVCTIWPSRHTV
jgi:hypothetical protein